MKNLMRVITICSVFIFLFGSISFAANNKVGYINLQRLVNESKMGKSAREDILKMRREKEKAVAAKQNQINRLRNEINTTAAFHVSCRKTGQGRGTQEAVQGLSAHGGGCQRRY